MRYIYRLKGVWYTRAFFLFSINVNNHGTLLNILKESASHFLFLFSRNS